MVFKKFTEAILSAAVMYGPEQAEKIRQLEAMGFAPERARHALNATNGDVDHAAELLLLSANDAQENNTAAAPADNTRGNHRNNYREQEGTNVAAHNDEQMRQAIEESLLVNQREEERQLRHVKAASMKEQKEVIDLTGDDDKEKATAAKAKKKNTAAAGMTQQKQQRAKKQPANNGVKSAAAINAGKAAAARHNNNYTAPKRTLDQTHPNVKVPEKLANKTKEEQIMRCANRLKTHVMAVDTLLRVLTSVRNSPNDPKFRIIDRGNANYVKFVKDKPGAEDMLLAMNYRHITCNNELRLERHLVDDALLYLGISALEQMRKSPEYIEGKKLRAFHAEMRRIAKGNGSGEAMQRTGMTEGETAIRLAFLSKCPKEPPEGRGAWVYVYLGEESEKIEGGHVQRRFDGDDTLEDVLNWLGGCYGSEVLDKIRGGSTREW